MRVKTNLTVIVSEDMALTRRVFSVEDLEEADDYSLQGGDGRGNLIIPVGETHTLDFAPLDSLKHFVLLVDGEVEVRLNGVTTGFRLQNRGTSGQADFVYGKLLLAGNELSSVELVNTSASRIAKCLIGYAG